MSDHRYMMATRAYHKLGDISGDAPDLCVVNPKVKHVPGDGTSVDEIFNLPAPNVPDGDYYVGQWVSGFGFTNVHFPVETTRPLTEEEIVKFENSYYQLAHNAAQKMTDIRNHS